MTLLGDSSGGSAGRTTDRPLRHVHEALIVDVVSQHSDALLRTAIANSASVEDAQDAYQRALEKFTTRAGRLTREGAPGWLHVVVRNEARAVRRARLNLDVDLDSELERLASGSTSTPEERALAADRTARAAEALAGLKPDERKAIALKAIGHSYDEIAEHTGWTRTKINRSLAEGRARLAARMSGIDSGAQCEEWAPYLSQVVDGEATAELLLELRPHLRHCAGCRATLKQLADGTSAVRLLFPGGLLLSVERTGSVVERLLPVTPAGGEAGIVTGGFGSIAAIATKSTAVLAVTAASVVVPSKAVPERDAHATVTVKTVESAAPAARRSVSTTRQKSARQKTEASTTSAANAPTRQERRDARAAQEFVPPRAPEPAVPVRPTQADEFTP